MSTKKPTSIRPGDVVICRAELDVRLKAWYSDVKGYDFPARAFLVVGIGERQTMYLELITDRGSLLLSPSTYDHVRVCAPHD